MTQPRLQSAWIVLPCTVLSLFLTLFLTAFFVSYRERGLSIVAKAALIFITTLILTTTLASSLLQPASSATSPNKPPRSNNVLHKKQKIAPTTDEGVRNWRDNTAPTLRWSSSSSDETKEEVKPAKKKKKLSKEQKEVLEEKSLRKRLAIMFKPKRYEMLGVRKETVGEVVWEDPLV
jgi:hypothetical protein